MKDRDYPSLEDDSLIALYRSTGQPVYFELIYLRHCKAVYYSAQNILRDSDAAKEATQDTFVKAIDGLRTYKGGGLEAWLVVICRNLCIDSIRKSQRYKRFESAGGGSVRGLSPAGVIDQVTVVKLLEHASKDQQISLKLFYFKGLTYKQIADRTGLTVKTIKSQIQNGLKRMKAGAGLKANT